MNIPSKAEVAKVEREHVISVAVKGTLSSSVPNDHRLKKHFRCMTGFNMPNTARLITKALGKEHGSHATAKVFTGRASTSIQNQNCAQTCYTPRALHFNQFALAHDPGRAYKDKKITEKARCQVNKAPLVSMSLCVLHWEVAGNDLLAIDNHVSGMWRL